MATKESLAIRANVALARIEMKSAELEALGLVPSRLEAVRRLHQDREMLRVLQLEAIAEWVEAIPANDELVVTAPIAAQFIGRVKKA